MKKLIIYTIAFGITAVFAGPQSAFAQDDNVKVRSEKKTVESEVRIDRSKRTSPYAATPYSVMSSANEASRYRTDQGWSRGRNFGFWVGRRGSDIPTAGYSTTTTK